MDQKCLLWVFLDNIFKKLLSYLKWAHANLTNCKISWKNNIASIFEVKWLIWAFLGWNFKNLLRYSISQPSNLCGCKILGKNSLEQIFKIILSYLKATPSNLLDWRNSWKKKKCLHLGPKMFYFRIFGIEFSKNYCHIWNHHTQIREILSNCKNFNKKQNCQI